MDPIIPSQNDANLKLLAAVTLTATANGAALDLGQGYAPNLGGEPMQAVGIITSVKTSATNETYAFKVQDSPDNSTWTDRSPSVLVTAAGALQVSCAITQRYVRLVYTLGGTAPSIVMGNIYLNPFTN